MEQNYPAYSYSEEDVRNELAQLMRINPRKTHAFDEFHAHEYHEIIVFLRGGGVHNINFEESAIRTNSIHILSAGDLHWVERNKQSEGFLIIFKEEFLYKLGFLNPDIPYNRFFSHSQVIDLDKEMAADFQTFFEELQLNKSRDVYMLSLIGTFLTKIVACFDAGKEPQSSQHPLTADLTKLINKNFKKRLSMEEYAKLLHTSPGNLRKIIKAHTGQSVQGLQQARLLKEAKKLLCYPDYNISDVAYELGFKETAHFSNWFKKQVGKTPSEYKR